METYIANSIVTSALPVMEPAAMKVVQYDGPDLFGVTPDHAYAYRLLGVCSDIYSKWFMVMKAAISREKVCQRLRCEYDGTPISKKMPYHRPVLTSAEESTVGLCYSMVSSLFDSNVAEYAMMKFNRAIDTGDKRSFKIRLLILKSRDSLKGSRLYKGFCDGSEECIANAEKLAGCIPDPSPRRMSKAEKAKAAARMGTSQPMLFENDLIENTPREAKEAMAETSGGPSTTEVRAASPTDPVSRHHVQECEAGSVGAVVGVSRKKRGRKSVTVTNDIVTKRVTVTKDNSSNVIRKTKIYSNIAEIAADIENGMIVPYQSDKEVVGDINKGIITPAEAVLFLSEMVKRKRSISNQPTIPESVSKDIDDRLSCTNAEDMCGRSAPIPSEDIDMVDDMGDGFGEEEWMGDD